LIIVKTTCLLTSLVFIALFAVDCNDKKPTSVQWRTDPPALQSRLPFLNSIERCWWVMGVAQDRSKGSVPAPDSSFLRGYAKLSAEETSRIAKAYEWKSISSDSFQPVRPPAEYGVPAMSGSLLVSDELMRSLVGVTTFRNGQIVLSPSQQMIYFDLAQD